MKRGFLLNLKSDAKPQTMATCDRKHGSVTISTDCGKILETNGDGLLTVQREHFEGLSTTKVSCGAGVGSMTVKIINGQMICTQAEPEQ
jgi:hypothetical protein